MYLESSIWNRFLSVFLAALIVCLPVVVRADDNPPDQPRPILTELSGRVTSLNLGQKAPFSGILLDSEATAKILADRKFLGLKYELKLDLEIKKLISTHQLTLGLLQARFDGLNSQHVQILKIKSDEITRLQEIIKDRPNSNSEWWLAGGIVVGILISIGVFYAAVEVSKQ
jgi:hypothetical protein